MKKSTNPQQGRKVAKHAPQAAQPQPKVSSEPVKEKIDLKKLIIYSEIMTPKFKN